MNADCADLQHIAVYPLGSGDWAVGHVRVGPTGQWSERGVNEVQKRLRRQFQLDSTER